MQLACYWGVPAFCRSTDWSTTDNWFVNAVRGMCMDEVIERVRAAKEQLALANVFDDWLNGEIIVGYPETH